VGGFHSLLTLAGDAARGLRDPQVHGLCAAFVALVFGWAGAAKLRRPALAAMAMVDFGVARRARPGFGRGLGAVEVALALVLASGFEQRAALAVAGAICAVFALVIGRSLVRGDTFACFCFGDSSAALSSRTLVRTLSLGALAVTTAVLSAPAVPDMQTLVLDGVGAVALLASLTILARIDPLLRSPSTVTG
jgi:hypothetical protein